MQRSRLLITWPEVYELALAVMTHLWAHISQLITQSEICWEDYESAKVTRL